MSQSPDEGRQLDEDDPYLTSITALNLMMAEGRSFSGHERNCCFLNTGGERFADVSSATGLDFIDDGRAVALTDWDHDGDLDMWIANRTAPSVRFMRNDMNTANHFVAFKLVGKTCNRDAIGARVQLELDEAGGPPRVKTVEAGHGFLTQSSKWLHFGLGDAQSIRRLTVRWPGGQEEVIKPPKIDGRYEIVQGSGVAAPMKMKAPSKRSVRLVASEQDIPASPDNVRVVVLRYRGLEPTAKYKSFDGQTKPIGDVKADAKLILLWASWCPTCRTELQELAKHAGRIRGAGIEILALNIDDADLSHPEDGTDAAKFLHEIDFPFPSGIAEHELLGDLEELDADTLQRHRPLPVPTSFLIAADGTIVALYKGPVDVAQLIADAGMRQRSADEVRNAAVPLAGRWSMPQGEMPRVDPSISMYWSALLADFKSLLLLAAIPVLLIALIVYRLRRWSAARTRRREAAPSN